ncbi:OmpA/MotB family protein [Niveispirillum irakense]|uniref:OmpA/MotB family protein n=1 Tax=Niveispirillum irakense TaxID=34011 RepID=UPI000415A9ED|nr:flagellar motor protein MotB [Niveispirillum irakense]
MNGDRERLTPDGSPYPRRPPPNWRNSVRPSEHQEESEEWVISYMDMVTLLMTVFLGMLAILGMEGRLSVVDDKERAATTAAQQALAQAPASLVAIPATIPSLLSAGADTSPPPGGDDQPDDRGREKTLSPTAQAWLEKLEAAGLPRDVDINVSDQKIAIVVRDRILFPSASATLQPEAVDLLRRLAPSLQGLPGSITVEGHSDDQAINTVRFPSNWELSAARAAAVVRVLQALGLPAQRMAAAGYADSRPLTDDPLHRAENRRVEIVIDTDATTAGRATR